VSPGRPARKSHGVQKDPAGQKATTEADSKSSGTGSTVKPSEDEPPNSVSAVVSVAELTGVICRHSENRKKRLKLAEALRECGFDESKAAELLFGLAIKLSCDKEGGAGGLAAGKLLLEVVKEVRSLLEPHKTLGNSDVMDAPTFARLRHNVPRPVRPE
jgi:hypothetical protein